MSTTVPSILGQNKPNPNVDTNLFTVATGTQVQFSIFVCNQSNSVDNFTIALVPNGGIEGSESFIAYNTPLTANGVFSASGLYLNSGDQVRVLSVGGNMSFTATGMIISN